MSKLAVARFLSPESKGGGNTVEFAFKENSFVFLPLFLLSLLPPLLRGRTSEQFFTQLEGTGTEDTQLSHLSAAPS